MKHLIAMLVMALVSTHAAHGAEETAESLLAQANGAYAEAVRERASNESKARELLAQSIELYRQVKEQHGVHNGGLEYNIGNAYALSGDTGRAILHYKRAQAMIGAERDLEANLKVARAKVAVAVPSRGNGKIIDSTFGWTRGVPPAVRLWIAIGAFACVWVVLGMRLTASMRRIAPRWLVLVPAAVAVFLGTSLWLEERQRVNEPEAVVVAKSVVGRKGPDERGYEPSFSRPLSSGVEVVVLESRPGWVLVKLGDGRETWLPEGAVERVEA